MIEFFLQLEDFIGYILHKTRRVVLNGSAHPWYKERNYLSSLISLEPSQTLIRHGFYSCNSKKFYHFCLQKHLKIFPKLILNLAPTSLIYIFIIFWLFRLIFPNLLWCHLIIFWEYRSGFSFYMWNILSWYSLGLRNIKKFQGSQ